MNFYFSQTLNLCADERWVVGYYRIRHDLSFSDEDKILKQLLSQRLDDWKPCEVSNTIEEGFHDYGCYKYY